MERTTHLFDAQNKVLGRLATEIARTLSGKGKVDYTPNIDGGDIVVVINAGKIALTGTKEKNKVYYRFTGYPGGIKDVTVEEQRKKDARKIITNAVYGMLPKNKLGNQMQKRLFVFNSEKYTKKIDITHE